MTIFKILIISIISSQNVQHYIIFMRVPVQVLDRSLFKVGGEHWWSVINCRVKAQRIYSDGISSSEWMEPLRNCNNYAICSRTKANVGPLTLDNSIEVEDAGNLLAPQELLKRGAVGTHSSVRLRVHGHTVCGKISTNMDNIECSGDYARVPKSASIDISSQNSQDGLQYRAGMYQVTAPSLEVGIDGSSHRYMRTSLHAQGAVAVEGEAYIWKPKQAKDNKTSTKVASLSPASQGIVESSNEVVTHEIEDIDSSKNDEIKDDGMDANSMEDADVSMDGYVSNFSDGEKLEPSKVLEGTKSKILPVSSDSIIDSISESVQALENIRANISKMTEEVQEGALQRFAANSKQKKQRRARPYSFLLSQPHIKVAASLGCLARMPVPNQFGIFGKDDVSDASAGPVIPSMPRNLNASTTSLVSKASFTSQLADTWEPYLKRTTLRVFSSIGLSAQVGKFARPYLDYTALDIKFDLGLNSQHVVGSLPTSSAIDMTSRPDKHRAFALEGKGIWHSCTISAAQQVFGPVRVKADFRFALDPMNIPQNQGERSTLKGIAQTALSVRPSLLESMFGGDLLIPGTEGAARLGAWWSPKRKEGMIELRLF